MMEATATELNKTYVDPNDGVLDPSLIEKSLIERMPKPTGWRLLILPYRGKGKTEGGILLPDKIVEEGQISTQVGYVLKAGSLAYKDTEKFPTGPWCEEKDWVMFARYAGSRFKIDGGEVQILNDDEILAKIMDLKTFYIINEVIMSGKEAQAELDLDLGEEEGPDVEVTVDKPAETVDAEVDANETNETEDEFKKSENQTQKVNRLTKKCARLKKMLMKRFLCKAKEQENQQLAQKLNQMGTSYVDQYSSRVESDMAQTETALRNAMEIGDTEAAVAAQRKMTQLAVEADRASQAKAANEKRQKQAPAPSMAQQTAPQAPARPDPKAESWAQRNDWFGEDSAMTYAAFGIHKELVEQEGIDPKSDEYYDSLDRRMKEEFPHKFKEGSQSKRPAQTVASVNRSSGNSGRSSGTKVRLTQRQVAMAKKLGVSLEQYAKYVKE